MNHNTLRLAWHMGAHVPRMKHDCAPVTRFRVDSVVGLHGADNLPCHGSNLVVLAVRDQRGAGVPEITALLAATNWRATEPEFTRLAMLAMLGLPWTCRGSARGDAVTCDGAGGAAYRSYDTRAGAPVIASSSSALWRPAGRAPHATALAN